MKPSSSRTTRSSSWAWRNRSYVGVGCDQLSTSAWSWSVRPSHSAARSGRFGVRLSLQSTCPVNLSVGVMRHWKSGPRTRLWPPPSISREVASRLTNDCPMSWRTRSTPTPERKSWSAASERRGPGRITCPCPRSRATSAVNAVVPARPVARRPKSGEVTVRVYTAWNGVENRSTPSRKNERFSGKNSANRSFATICAASDSTWEKSGLSVPSTASPESGLHLISAPDVDGRRGCLVRGRERRDHEVRAVRKLLEPGQLARVADEAVHVAWQAGGEELVVAFARVVAVEEDAPGLDRRVRVAERRERDAQLERVAFLGDLALRVPEEVRRAVLPRHVAVDRVVLEPVRIREELHRGLAVVPAVHDDAAVVREARERVVVAERRPDQLRVWIVETKRRVEVVVVGSEETEISHLGLDVVADAGLEPRRHGVCAPPAGVGEIPVDDDGSRGTADREQRPGPWIGRARGARAGGEEQADGERGRGRARSRGA